MNARTLIATVSLLGTAWSGAQNVAQEPQEDPVQKAIREFNQADGGKPNEITVDLSPSEKTPPGNSTAKPDTAPPAEESPVLVTGKPPEGTELVKEGETAPAESQPAESQPAESSPDEPAAEEPAPKPRPGLAVRVEKLQTGTGSIDPAQVKLLAPFPAKPLSQAPAGWRLESSENAPPFTREVELAPGKKITLTVRPHLLVPDADGAEVFSVQEPGYDPSLGYRQNATVGAILSQSIRQLDEDSKQLGAAIDNLQQLLVSLPKPEPQPAPAPEPAKAPAPARKR